ncbi:MAG: cation transporter [Paludibacteraceae bacterium]|jgi:copper chaperone CopZ|nr:cation transporter [Paludibacteraceae bacterium]
MKKLIITLVAFCFSIATFAAKNSVQFNAMISKSSKKKVEKFIKKQPGIISIKTDMKMGLVTVVFDDSKTNVNAISGAFRSAGVFASAIGENCANKPGGCLNNAPKTTNTMR